MDALLTRPGVFTYHDAKGKPIREYRPPEEVFAADSMASLEDAPVTIRHPSSGVNADNWSQVAIGHARDARKDAAGVAGHVVVAPGAAVSRVGKDLREVSCGYSVDLDFTPGATPEGERYDAVQRNIRYNHVGLGPPGWGRQGPQSALRLDSAGDEIQTDSESPSQEAPKTMKIKFDGIEFEGATDAEVQAKIDAHIASKGVTTADAALATERGKSSALETQLAAEKARADAAPGLARAQLEARAKLEATVSPVLGKDYKFDGKTDREIKVALIQKHDGKFTGLGSDGKAAAGEPCADGFLDGTYSVFSARTPEAGQHKQDGILNGLSAPARGPVTPSVGSPEVKYDGLDRDKPSASAARATMYANLGKRPAAVTK